jgi:hypothetical protein
VTDDAARAHYLTLLTGDRASAHGERKAIADAVSCAVRPTRPPVGRLMPTVPGSSHSMRAHVRCQSIRSFRSGDCAEARAEPISDA